MIDRLDRSDGSTRTGHFVFRVWGSEEGAWSWRLRVEAVDTGAWGVFDSIQEALCFMRKHLAADEDGEADRQLESACFDE